MWTFTVGLMLNIHSGAGCSCAAVLRQAASRSLITALCSQCSIKEEVKLAHSDVADSFLHIAI